MSLTAPKIDTRTRDQIVEQTEQLVQTYTDWQPPEAGQGMGSALIGVFGRFAELVIERLNQAPDKNFLAFLDLIGAQVLPPRAARVPLTFSLAADLPVDALVPAGARAAAILKEGEEEEIVFETDEALVMTAAQLKSVFVCDPGADQYADRTQAATGVVDEATQAATGVVDEDYAAFGGQEPIEHSLYLACDDLFTLPGLDSVTLTIESPDAAQLANLPITWSYWDGDAWKLLSRSWGSITSGLTVTPNPTKLKVTVAAGGATDGKGQTVELDAAQEVDLSSYTGQMVLVVISYQQMLDPSAHVQAIPEVKAGEYPPETYIRLARLWVEEDTVSEAFSSSLDPSANEWQVTITKPPSLSPRTINGREARWLRAVLEVPLLAPIHQQDLVPATVQSGRAGLDLSGPYAPFGSTEPLKNFYLHLEPLFAAAPDSLWQFGETTVTLDLSLAGPGQASPDLALIWEYFMGTGSWQELGQSAPGQTSSGVGDYGFDDGTQALTVETGSVCFRVPTHRPEETLHGLSGRWLRVRVAPGSYTTLPQIQSLRVGYESVMPQPMIERITAEATVEHSHLAPDLGFANDLLLDLGKDFYPLGERPRLGDAFYVSCQDAFAMPGAEVTIDVQVSDPLPIPLNPSCDLVVRWEAWNGDVWQKLETNLPGDSVSTTLKNAAETIAKTLEVEAATGFAVGDCICMDPGATDQANNKITAISGTTFTLKDNLERTYPVGTHLIRLDLLPAQLTSSGQVSFTLPGRMGQGAINGETGYWVRAHIAGGNFGTDVSYHYEKVGERVDGEGVPQPVHGWVCTKLADFGPPSLAALKVSCNLPAASPRPLTACQTLNDFAYVDCTDKAASGGTAFAPFSPARDTRPALYLGFDRPFANRPIALYAQVKPPRSGELADRDETARVVWEYAVAPPDDWRSLGAVDETVGFAERGLIKFIGPADLAQRSEWGQDLCWLRARWAGGQFSAPPRLHRLLTNTTWASHAMTIRDEPLGSSDGSPNQTFDTIHAPVLLGQRLEVRELDLLSLAEREAIEALEGEDAITVIADEAGRPEEVWVRWHETPDFHGSAPRDRHYVLDHLTGEVCFGDGQQGLIPPLGRNNVRMALYRAGGGSRGDRPAETITEFQTALPYVAGVTNYEAASGGADQESLAQVKERGPKALRHRGRAVTVQDFEDLAYQASPDVARAWAITPRFDPLIDSGDLEWMPTLFVFPERSGEIRVEAMWKNGQNLKLSLNGPGQGAPYAQLQGPSPLEVSYTITEDQFKEGDCWQVTISNPGAAWVDAARVVVHCLDDVQCKDVQAPPVMSQQPEGVGRVDLILVPRSAAAQPMPSMELVNQVQDYIRERCVSTVRLQVAEPHWVRVMVEAQLVPVSWQAADALGATIAATLERFLHPLDGGFDGQGWPFGRRPHDSDLYALLESAPDVDYVNSLSVVSERLVIEKGQDEPAFEPLSQEEDWDQMQDRFLIYSGEHKITAIADTNT